MEKLKVGLVACGVVIGLLVVRLIVYIYLEV
jgi:hypothetical protein